ncbi:hypothetical protein KVT40_008707 [Elsinoe batatas]|uniref:Uncharacterized protein n=1 Tax=Elsinoe batatas TaxID=2601811 RepID=A0A8K0PBS6_9PEZI|nr:hypothetical protein KVT40_008707 [Elsinoe batatas]
MTSNTQQKVFSGRGGAGNVAPASPSLEPVDLSTPTIKQNHYTTGRGGSGNIVSNDSAENARKAQDVEASAAAAKQPSGDKPGHFGRGGAANVVKKAVEGVKEKVTGSGKEGEGK